MITVFIPVSPIKSHPSTEILEQTIDSVRYWLPDAELIVTFDGVREEQEHCRADYEESIRRSLWLLDKKYQPTVPYIFDKHTHQVGMLRTVLDQVHTPLLMFVEQDTPLVTNQPIEWNAITHFIQAGRSNCVRLHHEAVIPEEHLTMMHGEENGFIRTSQFSARPHIATVAFYRQLLHHFSPDANCFVEDLAHGILDNSFKQDGMAGWNLWRLHIYARDPNNLKRSLHTDGRAGENKFDEAQVF
jgi:hypothetical protein